MDSHQSTRLNKKKEINLMPNNLIKSLAKKSGKSKGDIEKGWKGGEAEAEKKGLAGDSKYAYANAAAQRAAGKKKSEANKNRKHDPKELDRIEKENDDFEVLTNPKYSTPSQSGKAFDDLAKRKASRRKEMFDPNQLERGLETQSRTMNRPTDPKVVNSAFELNKAKADQAGIDKTSPDYWAKVAGDTGKDIGLYSDQETPLSFNQRGDQQKKGAMSFQRESYVTFEQELEGLQETTPSKFTHTESPKNSGDRDEHLQGYTKVELAKEFAKNLKKKGLSRNEIIYAINNRLLIDVDSAKKIVDGEEVEQIDNDGWAPTDPVTPGYRNSISSIYQDVDEFKEDEKKN